MPKGDVLDSSTGDGSLGKTCVFKESHAAIADGHVAIIRADKKLVHPEYLADYLRIGLGALQIERLYTGYTGQIELSPEMLDRVVVDMMCGIKEQKEASTCLISAEIKFIKYSERVANDLATAKEKFC